MSAHEDDVPKLAEISRTLSDFRNEFREAVNNMVRRDVYLADHRTLEVRMTAMADEHERAAKQLKEENDWLSKQMEAEKSDRKGLRNLVLGSILGTVGAIVVALVK